MNKFIEFGPYEDAYESLKKCCDNYTIRKYGELPFSFAPQKEVIKKLEITPGLFFASGNSWESILKRMESWEWIARINKKGLEDILIISLKEAESES
ncbi:MAG: hypothetical protein KJ623_04660 [Nanoarchaeota archaeon]|nr:hypothetical protein [Nanoarchaeota archaeon]MBU0962518.1 hypothetical protein [Nanoarchaeota archaeon]